MGFWDGLLVGLVLFLPTGLVLRHPVRAYHWIVKMVNRLRGKDSEEK